MLLASDSYATYGILAAMVIAIWLLMWWTQRSMARSRTAPRRRFGAREDEDEPKSAARREEAPIDFNRWEVEMHDIMRTATGQLDSKMGLLEHLIREADRAAARLESALSLAATKNSGTPSDAAAASDPAIDAARRQLAALRSGGESTPLGEVLGHGPGHGNQAEGLRSASTPLADEPDRPGKPRRYEEIYTLSDYGYGAAEIAQRLAMPVGEIELILGLRAQR